jgi:nicotinamide-nucleotide amidase
MMNTTDPSFQITNDLNEIAGYLIKKKETLAVAESVTSGHIQALLSGAEQASRFFQGGITTYNLNQKSRHLEVDALKALANNCVSEQVSKEMAKGVCKLFSCDWGLAITGYATLLPEASITTLFSFYSFAYRSQPLVTRLLKAKVQDSTAVQQYYAHAVLNRFSNYIKMFSP